MRNNGIHFYLCENMLFRFHPLRRLLAPSITDVRNAASRLILIGVVAAAVLGAALGSSSVFAYDDRVALVIGNDAYPTDPLKNAQNDARAVAKTLSDLGFKVVVKTNADIVTMRSAAVEFTKVLEGAKAAVLYYAGHGIQYRDKNFMVPIDAKFTSEAEIVYNAVEVGQILESMDDAKVPFKFVILDACRNNPFSNVFAATGLAKISKVPPGTIVAYAAAAGAVALDGDGVNGLYTKHLLETIRNPEFQAGLMFQRVQTAVAQESGNKQLPELYSTPLPRGAFFFAERASPVQAVSQAGGSTSNSAVSGDAQAGLDREFWTSIKDSKNIKDFQAYLESFPSGAFAPLVRNRIDGLKQAQSQIAAAPLSAASTTVAPVLVAEAPAASPVTKIEVTKPIPIAIPKPEPALAAAPIQVALTSTSVGTNVAASETRGIEARPTPTVTPAAPVPAPTIVPAIVSAVVPTPRPIIVASLSPDQKTSAPLPSAAPKILAGLIEFPDGARYNGEYKEDKDKTKILHGPGEYTSTAFRYKGDFKDGKKQGRGVYEWANGDRFDGDFTDDSPNGRGIWIFASGDKYEGEVKNSSVVGKGVFITKNGDKIDGTFADAKANGRVLYVFANGDKYEGEMLQGRMTGKGIYVSKSGDRTEANFVDGNAQGKGTYYFSNGDRYEGDIKVGALTGQGSYFYSNGLRSDGEYVNGVLKGNGAFYFNDGSWFEGQFEDGLRRAKGRVISKDGTKRVAEMVDGVVKIIE